LQDGPHITKRIAAEFASTVKTTRGESLRVIVGLQSIRIIADQKALENFRGTLRPKRLKAYVRFCRDLTCASQRSIRSQWNLARVTAGLALNDVNLTGIMCCAPGSILLLADRDRPLALEVR